MSSPEETGKSGDPDHESYVQNQLIERLAQSERQHRDLLIDLPDVVISLDVAGRLTYVNTAWEKRFGFDSRASLGKLLSDYLHPNDQSGWHRLSTAGDPSTLPDSERVLRVMDASGESHLVETRLRRLESGEVVGSLEDVTIRHQLETERLRAQHLESIGRLAGGLAHDFNNLLTVIIANITLAKRKLSSHDLESDELGLAQRGCDQAALLAKQMLAFSRGGEPNRQAGDLGELVRDGLELFLRGTNVRSELRIEDGLPPVDMDRSQIHQVLNNLVVNACQAMPDGGRIRVDVESCTFNGAPDSGSCRGVSVSVRDEGYGIPADHLEHIFEPYFTTKETGNGLGLTSAYWIMKRHDGLLHVESARGIGTLFRFTLPLARTAITSEDDTPRTVEAHHGRILVMDDEQMVRDALIAMLQCLGHEAVGVADGEACVAEWSSAIDGDEPFDLVIIDLTIAGGRDGLWAIKKLREIDPDVLAVVASGYSNAPVISDHARYGFAAVLPKPMSLEDLEELLNGLLASTSRYSE